MEQKKKRYEGIVIKSHKTQRVFRVLEQKGFSPDVCLRVQMISSPNEEHPMVHEPFWLEHHEWEEVEHLD